MRDEDFNRMFEEMEARTMRQAVVLGVILAVGTLLLALVGGI